MPGEDALSERMLDAILPDRSGVALPRAAVAFRAAGVDLPNLPPPIEVDGAREVIRGFRF